MSDCLHCDINQLVQQRLERGDTDLGEVASMLVESLADLILLAPDEDRLYLMAHALSAFGEMFLEKSGAVEGGSSATHQRPSMPSLFGRLLPKTVNRADVGGCHGSFSRVRHPRLGPWPRDSRPCHWLYGGRPDRTLLAPQGTIAHFTVSSSEGVRSHGRDHRSL